MPGHLRENTEGIVGILCTPGSLYSGCSISVCSLETVGRPPFQNTLILVFSKD